MPRAKRTLRPRRTNEQRSAETRGKLIRTAIDLLYRSGYSATTTVMVAKRAKVSRGAMLHQFRTRVDLLAAVAEHVVAEQQAYRKERLANAGTGFKRFATAGDVTWDLHCQPGAIALLEIMMATRSDAALRKRFAPLIKTFQSLRQQSAPFVAQDLRSPDLGMIEDLIHLHQMAYRGLAIELMFTADAAHIDRARRLFMHFEALFARELADKADRAAADVQASAAEPPPERAPERQSSERLSAAK
jgi:AcrR family transcriptional regulator